jgi:hypothetical protein
MRTPVNLEAAVPVGEVLSAGQRAEVERALRVAEEQSGLAFSLYVGAWEGGRSGAEAMHATLTNPDHTVLIAIDPGNRTLQIVTGRQAKIALDDRACELAAMSMTSSFVAGDLAGGIRDGLAVLGEQGRRVKIPWVDHP